MKFTYDLNSARTDDKTGDIFVPITTDVELDIEWRSKASEAIEKYNDHERRKEMNQPVCIVVMNYGCPEMVGKGLVELRIQPHHHGQIGQNMLDTQKKLLIELSYQATCDLEARIAVQKASTAQIAEANKKAPDLIGKLKELKG